MIQKSQTILRAGLLVFAIVLGLEGSWLTATEAVRPQVPYFPTGATAAAAASEQRANVAIAASLGVIRGDLWASYAVALSSDLLADVAAASSSASPALSENSVASAIKASGFAPFDSRIWLLLAIVDARLERSASEPLKMSYYTGPNDVALTPSRLLVASRTAAIADPELQILVGREIRMIVSRKPDLRPALFAAYREASPEGKRFIESEVGGLDRDLAAAIRTGGPAR